MRSKNIISEEVVRPAGNPFRRRTKITAPGRALRLLLVFAALALFCAAGAGTAAADSVTVSNFTELSAAISGAPTDNSEHIIVIAGDIGIGAGNTWLPAIGTGQNITLTPSNGGDYRIYRTAANFSLNTTGLFTISGGSLTIIDNGTSTLILDGNMSSVSSNQQSLVYVGNSGMFTMSGGVLTNNIASSGGGVRMIENAVFTMNGGTISGSTARSSGGGVRMFENTVFIMNGGSITGNRGEEPGVWYSPGGGVRMDDNTSFTMTGGEITNNTGDNGAVYLSGGIFTMSGDALIANNTAEWNGGGVWVGNTGVFNMEGNAVISGNKAKSSGGGVDSYNIFNMSGNAVISGNTAVSMGGGVLNSGTFTMSGCEISGNSASTGGGVLVHSTGNFMISDGNISGNQAAYGGGVFTYTGGATTMENSTISGNEVTNTGGNVYNSGTFTMESGTISGNTASATHGGGVYNANIFIMESGTISGNTAASYGGGVYSTKTFIMESGTISGNTVTNTGGGGVYSSGTFNMADGSISDNKAASGSGVYTYVGNFTMTGGEITNNTGTIGGVRVHNCTFAMSGDAVIAGNNVSNGGGVDVYGNGSFLMSGNAGITNNIATNTGGGVLISHAAGKFEMSDSARITGNTALTGGGVRVAAGQLTMSGSSVITGNIANNGNGVYVSTNAAFLKYGSARVNPTDEVYLSNNTFINITSQYLGETLNITHAVNVTGTKVIELHQNVAIDTYSESFGLSPLMVPFYLKYNVTESNVSIYELALLSPPTPTPTTTSTTPVPTTTPTNGGNTSNSFRVLFETFGGSYVPPATGLSYGDLVPVPVSPTKDGYTFGGWYRDEACTIAWIFATDAVPGDMTLYAKWIGGVVPTTTVSPTTTTPAAVPTGHPVASPSAGTPVPAVTGPVPDDSGFDNGIIYFFLLLLFLIFLFLILILRHTVTFLVTTAEGVEKYRVKVWHGKKIDTDDLPELIRETSWYADEEREEYWDLVEERVTKSIRLYPGIR